MPLNYGKSKAARQQNVETEIAAGKPPKQAVAIAYSVQRRGKPKEPTLIEHMQSHLSPKGKFRGNRGPGPK